MANRERARNLKKEQAVKMLENYREYLNNDRKDYVFAKKFFTGEVAKKYIKTCIEEIAYDKRIICELERIVR